MAEAIAQGHLIAIAELMVEASGGEVQASRVGEQAAIALKLVNQVLASCCLSGKQAGCRGDVQSGGHRLGASSGRDSGLTCNAGNRWTAQGGKRIDDGLLAAIRPQNSRAREKRDSVLRVAQQTFKGA